MKNQARKKIPPVLAGIIMCLPALLPGCRPDTYKAGTYTAAAMGYGGAITVEVVVDRNAILSVTVVEEHETKDFGAPAIDTLPGRIVEAQTHEVDAVSSATFTSEAIKAAVKSCVEQALVGKKGD